MNKQEVILTASQELFSQFGLRKVTTDDIAEKANVSKATVYRYYKNKNEIFQEVVKIETDQMINLICEAVNAETTLGGKFTSYLTTKIKNIHNLINFYRVTRETWGDHWPYIAEVHDYFMNEEKRIVREILRFGNDQGVLQVKYIDLHAHIFVISLKSIEYPWAVAGEEIELEELIDLIVDTFINGIKNVKN